MAQPGSLAASGYSLTIAFHNADAPSRAAAAAKVKARFPDPSKRFADLKPALGAIV